MRIIDVNTDVQSQKNNAQCSFVRTVFEQNRNLKLNENQDEQKTSKKARKTKRLQTEEI